MLFKKIMNEDFKYIYRIFLEGGFISESKNVYFMTDDGILNCLWGQHISDILEKYNHSDLTDKEIVDGFKKIYGENLNIFYG
jgi:hypothetical protein